MALDPTRPCNMSQHCRCIGCCIRRAHPPDPEIIEAEARADRLLRCFLTDEEWWRYRTHRRIQVQSEDGIFHVFVSSWNRWNVNVERWREHYIERFCVGSVLPSPPGDQMLTYLLWLKSDLRGFLQTARMTSRTPRRASDR